ncbi:autotransporter outer membrane beta-barrel domain-containing protein [Microvirga sp. W0021]|uniref:Autotransporter outer membrane beta-barrel domain-containing protein n=1 Tax=Hohaiivirga grylli TaxID=3133970 RepID=A0ABV0BGL2_9HYPH
MSNKSFVSHALRSRIARAMNDVSFLALARGNHRSVMPDGRKVVLKKAAAASLLAGAMLLGGSAYAADWVGSTNNQWSTGTNWSTGAAPNAAGVQVRFLDNDGSLNGKTITVTGSNTLGQLLIGGTDNATARAFTISGGTLNFDNSGSSGMISLSDNRSVTINSAVTTAGNLTISNSSAYGGSVTMGGAINMNGQALSVATVTNSTVTINGIISNASTVEKSGGGTLALNGANTFGGTFNFTDGTIAVGNNAAFGTSTISLVGGTSQVFDVSSGSRTLTNQVALNNGFSVVGTGNTLTFNATQTSTLTGANTYNVGNVATLAFGSGFDLQGAGSIVKQGYGTLSLQSKNNTFSGGLNIQQGAVSTGSFSDTLVIGSASGANHMLGTGDIILSDASSSLTINSAAGATVQFAGGTVSAANGSVIEVLNGATVDFAGGTLDFGTGAEKGKLVFTGDVKLGNTLFANAAGSTMTIGGNLTFNAGSPIGQSGIDFVLDNASNKTVSGSGAVAGLNGFTKQGAGAATFSGITSFDATSVSVLGGTLDIGTATITTSALNMGGGTLSFHTANQIDPAATITLLSGTSSVFNLNGFDQSFTTIAGTGALNLNLGGTSSSANAVTLGAITGSPSAIRISDWDGSPYASFDRVYTTSDPTASLSNVWFQGYAKGATAVNNGAGLWELRPTSFLSSEWNGLANDKLWSTAGNWVGGDEYSVPNHAGATAYFGNLAGSLTNVVITGGTNNSWTIGNLILNSSGSQASTYFNIRTMITFDSGVADVNANLTAMTAMPWLRFQSTVKFDSDTNITLAGSSILFISGPITGSGDIIFNGPGNIRFEVASANAASYTGDIYVQSGTFSVNASNNLGTGTLHIQGGAVGGLAASVKNTINNKLSLEGNFSSQYVRYTYNGDVELDAIRTITVSTNTTMPGEVASVTFDSGLNFTGSGGLIFNGGGTKEILSANNTFSGGLTVAYSTLFTTLTSDLVIGQLSPGNNYLGSGDITINSSTTSNLKIDSQGHSGTLAGGTLTVANGSYFSFLGGGDFTLAGGTLDATTNRGFFLVSGDLTFGGTTLLNSPTVVVDTTTNPGNTTTIYGSGTITGINNFLKQGSGTTVLDSGITLFKPNNIYLTAGTLKLGRDNQLNATSGALYLNGGSFNTDNYRTNIYGVYLYKDSSFILNDYGGVTFARRISGATNWYPNSILTIQNNGQAWVANDSATFIRFTTDPGFSDAELANIAFTGYESGAIVDNSTAGYWYLLPSASTTNEWGGGAAADDNWGTAANWLNNVVPNAAGESATIRDADSNLDGKTIAVDGNYTIGRLNVEASSGQTFTLGGSGTLTISGSDARIKHAGVNNLTLAANLNLDGATDLIVTVPTNYSYLELSSSVTGSGGFIKTGAGTLKLSGGGTSDYTGGFLWQDASVIQFNADGALFGSGVFTIGSSNDADTYRVETLGGSHTVTSDYKLAGNLQLQKDTLYGVTIADSIGKTNTLTFSGSGDIAETRYINVYGDTYVLQQSLQQLTLTLDGELSGAGNIIKTGYGILAINGANTDFSGGVNLQQGTLYVGQSNGLGTGVFTVSSTYVHSAQLTVNGGTEASPFLLNNQLDLRGMAYYTGGVMLFDYNGISTLTGIVDLGSRSAADTIIFGKNNVLSGTGLIRMGLAGTYSQYGITRFLGDNTYTGGTILATAVAQVGTDSITDSDGNVVSGALGTGLITMRGGYIAAYSEVGSGITTRRVSNAIKLDATSLQVTKGGDATTLVFDTPTITLRNGKLDFSANIATGATLVIESQLIDDTANSYQGGITKLGAGILELVNGDNQISDGIRVSAGTLLATATGDVTTGRLDAGNNYLGTGELILEAATTTRIVTDDGSTVRLSGSGITMNGSANLFIAGGTNVKTILDSNSSFTGTSTTGWIATSGQLIKEGEGTTTTIGARLNTPDLVISSGTLGFANANLMAGVQQLTMNGGTLALNGLNQTMAAGSQFVLTADSTIDFGSGSSVLTINNFKLSDDGMYVGSSDLTLSLANWSGNAGAGFGADQLIVTNLAEGKKLYNVWFTGGYTIGAKVILNANNQLELVPVGVAYTWDNHSNSALWAASNWNDTGAPISAGDGAVFADLDAGLDGRTISTGSGITVGMISFESTQGQQFTLSGGTITLDTADENMPAQIRLVGNSAPTIDSNINLNSNLVITADGTEKLTLNGDISGANKSVTINGTGTVALNGDGSNFTSGLTINSGTVEINASSMTNALGGVASGPAGLGTLTVNGGTLSLANGSQTLHNSVVLGGDFTVTGNNAGLTLAGSTGATGSVAQDVTITVDADSYLTFGEDLPLTGSGDITKAGSGTLNFNGDSAGYSGDVNVNAGTVGIGADLGFGTGSVNLGNGTTLAANADGLNVGNNIVLSSGSQTIATGANDLTLSGVISGDAALTKTGTGTLTLDAVSTYTGGTIISAGTVDLANASGAGTGAITINSGATLEASFSNGTLNNSRTGAGDISITGTNVRLAGISSHSGVLTVADGASALVALPYNSLGTATIVLEGDGRMTIDPPVTASFVFSNKISGTGTFVVELANKNKIFGFGTEAMHGGFTGVMEMGTGTLQLDAGAANVLGNATLQLNENSITSLAGNRSVGNLTMNGGVINTGLYSATGGFTGQVTTGNLDLTAGGVQLNLSDVSAAFSLLVVDDGVTNQLVSAATVTGDISNINLVDKDGNVLGTSSVQDITQSGTKVANATYNHSLSSTGAGGDGLYVTYQLTELALLASETFVLTERTGATGTAAELKAKVTGSGNLEIASKSAITISNATNDYSGSTIVSSGIAKAGVADVFKNNGDMVVQSGGTLDLNGFANQVNNLQGAGSVIASADLTANNTADSTFSGVISGSGNFAKTGSGELTLSGVSSFTGSTSVNSGSLKLTNAGAISSGSATVAADALMELAFNSTSFGNVIDGAGTVKVSGTSVTLAGTNTLSGQWDITGSAIATTEGNLGTAEVYLDGPDSSLTLKPSDGFIFANALKGNGTLFAEMGTHSSALEFTFDAGDEFAGTLAMGIGSYTLSGANTTALTNAYLRADNGSTITVDTGIQAIGGLIFNDGTVVFDATVPSEIVANSLLQVKLLDVNGTGTVSIKVPEAPGIPTIGSDNTRNLLSQDDSGALTQLVSSDTVVGAGGALMLTNQYGIDLQAADQAVNLMDAGGVITAAVGTYGYRLNTGDANDGLYVAYALKTVELLSGQVLTLTPDAGATGLATDLSAQVIGSGNLEIAAGSGKLVSLTNSGNTYTGTTTVTSGTLQLGSNNALGNTTALSIASGATTNVNGYTQVVNGAFTGASGSTLNLNNGSLTINNGGTSAGSLTGAGTLAIAGGTLDVTGANTGLTAGVSIASGATVELDNVAGIGNSGTATVAGDLIIDNATGNFSKNVAGAGDVTVASGSTVTLTGNNTLSGNWIVDAASALTASTQGNLGSAEIANAGSFTINTSTDWTLANDFTGAGSFTKSGSGNLTIAQANARTGTTDITAGKLTLTNADGVGSGDITVATTSASEGLNLAFATDQTFDNVLLGSGGTMVSGAGVATITGANSAYTGDWSITGKAALAATATDSQTNLGTGKVAITGTLNAAMNGAFTFSNELTGTGILNASNNGAAFNFTSNVGSAFAGTVVLSNNTFDLSGANTSALTKATLSLGANNITTVGAGSQAIGNLAFDGGMLKYANLTVPADATSPDLISTGNVTVSANGGSIAVNPATTGLVIPTTPTQTNLLAQDDDAQVKLVNANGTVTGAGGLTLTDLDGNSISTGGHLVDIIAGGVTVAEATYDYILSGKNNDGVYLGYGLKQLDLQSGQTLVLTPDVGATGAATDLSAKLTGSGNLAIDAINAGKVSLSNATNDYTGVTSVVSGTLQMANDNVLGFTSDVQIAGGTTLDMNGFSQTVGAVHTAVGGTLNIAEGSTLTVADSQRAAGDTDGGALETNSLVGSGTFIIDPSIVRVNGIQSGYTGNLQVTGGSQLMLNAAGAFNSAQSIELVGAEDKLSFANLSGYNAAWTAVANGTTAVFIKGIGTVESLDGSDIHLTGDNSAFAGQLMSAAGSVIRASEAKNVGTASIQADGTFNAISESVWKFDNVVNGTGVFLKSGAGVLTVDQALASFEGVTTIESGALVVGESSTTAKIGGSVRIESNGILSGTGEVAGDVYNLGRIVAYNALPNINGYGGLVTSDLSVGSVANAGSIILAGYAAGNTLTVNGDYVGMNGRLYLNTLFGGDDSATDRLVLNGGQATGTTSLVITNQGGAGAETNVGIQVITAKNGAQTEATAFKLDQMSSGYRSTTDTLAIGAYDYSLVRGGNGGDANSWYLTSQASSNLNGGSSGQDDKVVRPEGGAYQLGHQVARTMFMTSLHDRDGYAGQAQTNRDYAGWARVTGKRTNGRSAGNALSTSADTFTAQVGVDLFKYESPEYGTFYAGIMGGWGTSDTDAKSRQINQSKASGTVKGYSVGAYGTWYQNDRGEAGAYVDVWAQYNWFNHEVRGYGLPKEKYDAHSFTTSLEVGYSFLLHSSETAKIYLEPQVQLAYINYSADTLTEVSGTTVRYKGASGLLARAGARLYGQFNLDNGMVLRPYLEANYWYNQKSGKLYMNNDLVPSGAPRSFGEVKLGISGEITKNLQVWGDVGVQFGGKHYNAVTGQVGLKYTW